MIYILYGEDTYRSRKKVRDITDHFYAVAGSNASVVRIILSEHSKQEVDAAVTTGSLFCNKRLVLIEEPSDAPADVLQYMESKLPALASSADVFIIWDREPTGSGEAFITTATSHATKVQEYKNLTAQGAARFVEDEARTRGISLSAADKQQLLSGFSGDSWKLIQQMEQKALGVAGSPTKTYGVSPEALKDKRLLFSLVDAYGLRQRAKAWHIYHALLRDGVEPEKIFWTLMSHARTVIHISSLLRNGVRTAELPRRAGVHPFVAKKAAAEAEHVSQQDLLLAHSRLCDLDLKTKQGQGDTTLGLERILLTL